MKIQYVYINTASSFSHSTNNFSVFQFLISLLFVERDIIFRQTVLSVDPSVKAFFVFSSDLFYKSFRNHVFNLFSHEIIVSRSQWSRK